MQFKFRQKFERKAFNIVISIAISAILFFSLLFSTFGWTGKTVKAQNSEMDWQAAVNLSNSGSARKPVIVQGASGKLHALWEDAYAKFVYREFSDTWSNPVNLDLPFYGFKYKIISDQNGYIGVFWIDTTDNTLYYDSVKEDNMGLAENWSGETLLASGVAAFDIIVDENNQGNIIYARASDTADFPSGVYYRSSTGGINNWSASQLIYQSKYYRSFFVPRGSSAATISTNPIPMHVSITSGKQNNVNTLLIGWENPDIKKIFFSQSTDNGAGWSEPEEVFSPSQESNLITPLNLKNILLNDSTLQIWTLNEPGGNCSLVYRSRESQNGNWSAQQSLDSVFGGCVDELTWENLDSSEILFMSLRQNSLTLIAWDGLGWSMPQEQNELNQFFNPITYDLIQLDNLYTIVADQQLFLIARDQSASGDIWFSQRNLTVTDQWYGLSNNWKPLQVQTTSSGTINDIGSINGIDGNFHFILSTSSDGTKGSEIQVLTQSNNSIGAINVVLNSLSGRVKQIAYSPTADRNRVSILWQGGDFGQIYSAWVNLNQMDSSIGWSSPNLVQDQSSGTNPSVVALDSQRLIAIYSEPYDQQKGIYLLSSENGGEKWGTPALISNLSSLEDCPQIGQTSLAADKQFNLYISFFCETYPGGKGPLGLYGLRSTDSGNTWSKPVLITDQSVFWQKTLVGNDNTIHRIWKIINDSTSLWHSFSTDQGVTWTSPQNFALIEDKSGPTSAEIDRDNNLHVLQISYSQNGVPQILYFRWNGSEWVTLQNLYINTQDKGKISAITSAIDSQNQLQVGIALDTQKSDLEESLFLTTSYALNLEDQSDQTNQVASSITGIQETPTPQISITPTIVHEPTFEPGSINTSQKSGQPSYLSILIGILISSGFMIGAIIYMRKRNQD